MCLFVTKKWGSVENKKRKKLLVLPFKDHYLIKQYVGKIIISVQKLRGGSPLGRLSQRNYVLIKKKSV